jgi:hypothetical protein
MSEPIPFWGAPHTIPEGHKKLSAPIEEDTFYNEEQLNDIDLIREYIASRLRSEMRIERLKGKTNRIDKRRELLKNFRGMIYGGPEPFNDLLSDRDREYWTNPSKRFGGIPWSHERMFGPLGGKI